MEAVRVINLKVSYAETTVIERMNLVVPEGKISIIIGANGCGKSTLLKTMARILKPSDGEIYIGGENIKNQKSRAIAKRMAFLPQTPKCPEQITVRELVAYGRFPYQKAIGGMDKHDKEQVEWAIAETGLQELADRLVESLSGGQRQRVWIAMTLAQETPIILLDEPTTYLDMAHQLEVLELLQRLNQKKQYTIVMVLHELNQACRFADHIIGMKDGAVVCEGNPRDVITKETLKQIYGIDAILQESTEGYPICTQFERIGS
ncbi:MAG: ABC transporter ATP-binding protein [Clostridiales bacterium]|nr:ABC transporter ATP-binding protein [Clostridiales bacterium]